MKLTSLLQLVDKLQLARNYKIDKLQQVSGVFSCVQQIAANLNSTTSKGCTFLYTLKPFRVRQCVVTIAVSGKPLSVWCKKANYSRSQMGFLLIEQNISFKSSATEKTLIKSSRFI